MKKRLTGFLIGMLAVVWGIIVLFMEGSSEAFGLSGILICGGLAFDACFSAAYGKEKKAPKKDKTTTAAYDPEAKE